MDPYKIQLLLNKLEIIEAGIIAANAIVCKSASDYKEEWKEDCDQFNDAIVHLQAALESIQAAKNELYDYNNQTWDG